jgi:hypothetical protein
MYNQSAEGIFSMLNPFLHSEINFKQQKIIICGWIKMRNNNMWLD